jgi:polysaccharide export outer membrane protein
MRTILTFLACGCLVGCANGRISRNPLLASANSVRPTAEQSMGEYTLGCPDIVELRFPHKPEWNALASVDVDGRLPLGPLGEVPAQGKTLAEVQAAIAELGGLPPAEVTAILYEARSQCLTVYGPERNRQRSVGYRGPERVLDVLQRTGALQPGCSDTRDLAVVRANVAVGALPEVLRVDLSAIVEKGDDTTNVALQPGDQIHVGETRRSSLLRLLPEWLKPMYRKWMGIWPSNPWP